jgi:hypothetical protein
MLMIAEFWLVSLLAVAPYSPGVVAPFHHSPAVLTHRNHTWSRLSGGVVSLFAARFATNSFE